MVMRTGSRMRGQRPATATVELALWLPFLGLLFVIAVDFARVFYFALTLNNCSRNGAYYAADYPGIYGYGSTKAAAEADGGNIIPTLSDSDVSVLYSSSAGGPYDQATAPSSGFVQVTVNYSFKSITNYPGLPGTLGLSRATRMRLAPVVPSQFP